MSEHLAPFRSPIQDLLSWLKSEKVRGVVVGGVAASLLGRPRFTRDVDALVLLDSDLWESFLESGRKFGFEPRIDKCVEFARKNSVLLVTHLPSKIDVDVMFAGLPYEDELIANALQVNMGEIQIPLPTPEDLIIMKSIAMRPRDIGDIEGLLDVYPKLNLKRIRFWVGEFAAALENPGLTEQLEKLIARVHPPKRTSKTKKPNR